MNIKFMTFQQRVQSMTAKEIIMAMVDSLTPPQISIDMGTFGMTREIKTPDTKFLDFLIKRGETKRLCFGCAATNTICKISGKTFTIENVYSRQLRAEFLDTDQTFLSAFEEAIDSLRRGDIYSYNVYAATRSFAQIVGNGIHLPCLHNDYTLEQLEIYRKLANSQP